MVERERHATGAQCLYVGPSQDRGQALGLGKEPRDMTCLVLDCSHRNMDRELKITSTRSVKIIVIILIT